MYHKTHWTETNPVRNQLAGLVFDIKAKQSAIPASELYSSG